MKPFYNGWWHSPQDLEVILKTYGTAAAAVEASVRAGVQVSYSIVLRAAREHNIHLQRGVGYVTPIKEVIKEVDTSLKSLVHDRIIKQKNDVSVLSLADEFDVSPSAIRETIELLLEDGVQLADVDDSRHLVIDKVSPAKRNVYTKDEIGLPLLEGNVIRFGVVSDTHLNSNEEALEPLHTAYDMFEREGITTVFHAGDIGDGLGVYRGHVSEVMYHTFEAQRTHIVDNYPMRTGIQTVGIGGNHDSEGDYGRLGIDMFKAVGRAREDITYLGGFSAFVNIFTEEHPCWLHLLHGKGGMSYAYSYKAQKIVEKYTEERKPQILIPGHWHVQGSFRTRGVHVLFPGCFQWMSSYIERYNLEPAVGFHIVQATIGDDGKIVRWAPEWFEFIEGRKITRHIPLV